MTIQVIGSPQNTASDVSTTDVTTTTPGGPNDGNTIQAGDLLIWTIGNQNATVISDPAGWTLIGQGNTTGLTLGVWYRWATSNEPATYTATTPSARTTTAMRAWRGVDPSTPLDVAVPAALVGTGTPVLPGITPVTASAVILGAAASSQSSGGAVDFTGTNANGGIVNEIATTASGGVNIGTATVRHDWVSGAFTPTVTISNSGTRRVGLTYALRPAPAAPATTKYRGWGRPAAA